MQYRASYMAVHFGQFRQMKSPEAREDAENTIEYLSEF